MKQLLITIAAVVLVGCGESAPKISLFEAAVNGDIKAIKQHIAAGADPNAKHPNKLDWLRMDEGIPLIGAIMYSPLKKDPDPWNIEVIELLIVNGADVNVMTPRGKTMIDILKGFSGGEPQAKKIILILRKHGGKTGEELKVEGK